MRSYTALDLPAFRSLRARGSIGRWVARSRIIRSLSGKNLATTLPGGSAPVCTPVRPTGKGNGRLWVTSCPSSTTSGVAGDSEEYCGEPPGPGASTELCLVGERDLAQPPSREQAAPERDAGSAAGGGPQPQARPPPSTPLDSLSELP